MRSLGLATGLLALGGLSEIERHPDRLTLRMPAEPDLWSGNGIILTRPPGRPEAEIALFRRASPQANHVTTSWDIPDLDPEPIRAAWEPLGFEVSDALARTGLHPRPSRRRVISSASWRATAIGRPPLP